MLENSSSLKKSVDDATVGGAKSHWLIVLCKSSISLLISCLVVLSVIESEDCSLQLLF